MSNLIPESVLSYFSEVEMDRLPPRPERPRQAANQRFTGTEFGFEWHHGVPHAAVPVFRESGEQHHYELVVVDMATVEDAQ